MTRTKTTKNNNTVFLLFLLRALRVEKSGVEGRLFEEGRALASSPSRSLP